MTKQERTPGRLRTAGASLFEIATTRGHREPPYDAYDR